ncbi:hypothetical protein [Rubrivirga sp.]|uniref:hypothetical protein n=1 Tax=Rubrivirga sp. TaxID=1885344 RepID=UPI003B515DFB
MRSALTLCCAFAVLALTALTGCDSAAEELEGPAPEDLFPLEAGNRWLYRAWYLNPADADSFAVEITERLTFEHGGETLTAYAESRGLLGEEPLPWQWLHGYGRDGLYVMGGLAATDTMYTKRLVRRTPMQVGDRHRFTRLAYGSDWTTDPDPEARFYVSDDTSEVMLLANRHPFETPLGTFDCYVYWYEQDPGIDVGAYENIFEYRVPGVGYVAELLGRGRSKGAPRTIPEVIPTSIQDEQIYGAYVLYDYTVNEPHGSETKMPPRGSASRSIGPARRLTHQSRTGGGVSIPLRLPVPLVHSAPQRSQ